jgi:beta-mannosidase
VAHVVNDRGSPLSARLRIALYHDLEQPVGEGNQAIELAGHDGFERNVETIIGRFVDASWAYRFGPPAQDLVVASLELDGDDGPELLSQAFRFPAGRPTHIEPADRLGLVAAVAADANGPLRMTLSSRRLAYGLRLDVPGFRPDDDAFSVEPGGSRVVVLHPIAPGNRFVGGTLSALNLAGQVAVPPSMAGVASPVAAGNLAVDPQ